MLFNYLFFLATTTAIIAPATTTAPPATAIIIRKPLSEVFSAFTVELTDELEELLPEEPLLEEALSAGTEDVALEELEVLTEELDELTEELDVDVLPVDELEVTVELSVTLELAGTDEEELDEL